jgi:uncharacterized protein YdhG (YjbR/CyaY superfamily)
MKKAPKDVDGYIKSAAKELQGELKGLRAAIKEVAPMVVESISYGMPYYHHKGRLAYFGLAKAHIGLCMPTPVIAEHKDDLTYHEITSATIRIPLDKGLPVLLIKKLVKVRSLMNEANKICDSGNSPHATKTDDIPVPLSKDVIWIKSHEQIFCWQRFDAA